MIDLSALVRPRQALVIVSPDTVLRWRRRRFREYWAKLSGPRLGGRTPVSTGIKALVRRMAAANPLWGAPRIHGELKLGIDVAERTVSRLMPKSRYQRDRSSSACPLPVLLANPM
jgi:hypothetical protein